MVTKTTTQTVERLDASTVVSTLDEITDADPSVTLAQAVGALHWRMDGNDGLPPELVEQHAAAVRSSSIARALKDVEVRAQISEQQARNALALGEGQMWEDATAEAVRLRAVLAQMGRDRMVLVAAPRPNGRPVPRVDVMRYARCAWLVRDHGAKVSRVAGELADAWDQAVAQAETADDRELHERLLTLVREGVRL